MLFEAISRMPHVFNDQNLLDGQEYFDQEKVLNVRFSEGLIKARVKGGSGQIYDVHMDLKNWPKQPAHCSCSFRMNCKHAAACLLTLHYARKNQTSQSLNLDKKLEGRIKQLRLQQVQKQEQSATHRLVYLIEPRFRQHEHYVVIRLALAKILKSGQLGRKITFHHLSEDKRRYFIAEDKSIIEQLLERHGCANSFDYFSLRNSELLEIVLQTGRAFFYHEQETAIRLKEPLSGHCTWQLLPDGRQHMLLKHQNQVLEPLLLNKPWYWNKNEFCLRRIDASYPLRPLHYLLTLQPLSFQETKTFTAKMDQYFPGFPKPLHYQRSEERHIIPKAYLRFDSIPLTQSLSKQEQYHKPLRQLLIIRPQFLYDGLNINAQDACRKLFKLKDDVLQIYPRNDDFERLKMKELSSFLVFRSPTPYEKKCAKPGSGFFFVLDGFANSSDLNVLYQDIIPALKQENWQIYYDSSLYEEIIEADEVEWFSELAEQGHEFFSYQLGILIDGKSVNIVPLVAQLINKYGGGDALTQLPDQQYIKLPLGEGKVLQIALGRIKSLIELLIQYGVRRIDRGDKVLEIHRYQLMLMQEAEQAMEIISLRWQGAEELRHRLLNLMDKNQFSIVDVPKGLTACLRDYQREGLSWLQWLRQNHFGGVLADDMGLGKTIQTLAHLQYEKEAGRMKRTSLLIAPTSLVGNWQAEAKRFTPCLKVIVFHGNERHQVKFTDYDLVITTYGLVQRDKSHFLDKPFYYFILDESQFIKNARTKTTQIIQQIRAEHRLCLTGTPIENHLGELWSLFHFLMPGLLGDHRQFRQWFRTPIEKYGDDMKKNVLSNRIKPFMLRRTKNEVAKELPSKTEMTHLIEITDEQRDIYEAIRMSMEKKVRDAIVKQGFGKSHIILLDALLKLRQICCDPRLISLPEANMAHGSSAKLEALMTLLDNLMEEGRRVLVFSQFTSMLKLIEKELITRQYNYLKLTGQTRNRQELVERFQQGKIPVFLISLKAGGTGLNLTQADTVIHYDPWWNPAVEDQATDRSHRIGQENPVFVYKLITQGTVEEVILNMQKKKRHLMQAVLSSNTSAMMSLTEQDIAEFFAPMS
ncbi:DEAD/DEAH box helicase [Legionella israelensis]|uniref:DNA/RNA helicase SNF2 n=1 Tax=Legionella israelensis TaxID=454 RepID=A0A0W0WNY0_9GAMM|nr:DEAD/DEAH box helicase [Legionella israelensis]KTD34023.1 DNA/RNA helicase SNF2 [Legionella israelensis]QBS10644.1 DEAD/DEAH box helicase [Legionella israelensis]SCX84736.1 Superfamily II DNA or RNA helicase, SNF2 family [Legionella israelensis DSM 19235]STX57596.1 DNA/RNA helicase SNF2 [Legionella israelensis]